MPDKKSTSIKVFILERMLNSKIINELDITGEQKQNIDRTTMIFKWYKTIYDSAKFKIIRSFGDPIRNDIITIDIANDKQKQLVNKIKEFATNARSRNFNKKNFLKMFEIMHRCISKEDKLSLIL